MPSSVKPVPFSGMVGIVVGDGVVVTVGGVVVGGMVSPGITTM